jgi:hypothetical protein
MTERREWDWPQEPKRSRRPRIETVEILPARQPEREQDIHVNVTVHRNGHVPQMIIAGALLFLALRFLPYLGIGLLIAVALLIAYPIIGIVAGTIVAILAIAAFRNHRSGHPF